MSLSFKIENDAGEEQEMGADNVLNDYINAGYQNVSLSRDGLTMTATDPATGEAMNADLKDLVASEYGKVTSAVPQNVDYGGVNKSWRAAIEALPNDANVRKAYLQSKMDGLGLKDRKIIGDGEDFYSFNPETGKYSALTNSPGMDMSDVAGFGASAARMVGAIGGGALGGIGGTGLGAMAGPVGATVGGVAGASAGAATGGALADEGMRKVAGYFDPDFKNTMNNMSEEQQSQNRSEQGTRGMYDALGGGLVRVPGVSKVIDKMNPLSYIARGTGKAADVAGRTVGGAGKFVAENDMARSVATAMTPGLNAVQGAGFALRAGELPGLAAQGVKKVAKKFTPKGAPQGTWSKGAEEIMTPRPVSATMTDKFTNAANNFMSGGQAKVAREASEAAAKKAEQKAADIAAGRVAAKAPPINPHFKGDIAEEAIEAEPVRAGVRDTFKNIASKLGKKLDQRSFDKSGNVTGFQDTLERIGGKVGSGFQNMSTIGKGLERGADSVMKAGARTLQRTGEGTAKLGRGVNTAGRVLQPFEGRAILNQGLPYGAEEAIDAVPKIKRYLKPEPYKY